MTSPITVDLDKARAAVEALKANPPSHEDVASDPEAFLSSLGIQVDAGTLSTIQTKLASAKLASNKGLSAAPNQAAIVHIDT